MIKQNKKTKKWILYTLDGSRILGTHDTYNKALRQERAIQWSQQQRKNPYPYYENCGEAFEELENLFLPILDLQRDLLLQNLNEWLTSNRGKSHIKEYGTSFDIKDFVKKVKRCESLAELETLVNEMVLYEHGIKPIYFLTRNVKVEENVKFTHAFPHMRLESIKESGFYGRATPQRMTLTRHLEDFYIKDNGYIFAYHYSNFYDGVISPRVEFSCQLNGIASKAISFYFIPDEERQMIVPLKCIKDSYLEDNTDSYCTEYDKEFGENLIDPLKVNLDNYLLLYHQTDEDSAKKIIESKNFLSKEQGYVYFSNKKNSENTTGYGDHYVSLLIPKEYAEIDDYFPSDDESHYRVHNRYLKKYAILWDSSN